MPPYNLTGCKQGRAGHGNMVVFQSKSYNGSGHSYRMIMLPGERREILLLNYINDKDIFIFRWRIPQVLCEAPRTWGALTDVELLTRARLLGYKNNELEQNFLVIKPHNVYKALIDEVMTDLVDRRLVVREDTINYG